MKFLSKVLLLGLLATSAHADWFSIGKKLAQPDALEKLRKVFIDSGIQVTIDTPVLVGTTESGEKCSVDVTLLAQLPHDPDMGAVTVFTGSRDLTDRKEVVFDISPLSRSRSDDNTPQIYQLKSAENVLSLVSSRDETSLECQNEGRYICTSFKRSIDVTVENAHVTSVHISNKQENGELTCHITQYSH